MAFPQTLRVIPVELFVNNGWVDISSDVYARDNLVITRGGRDEQSRAEPQRCTLTINNRSGNYSPRNPAGIYYGSIGRNTPIRLAVQLANDTFTRTVSSGWGSTDTGDTYLTFGFNGVLQASNYNVASGVGTHLVPSAVNAYRSTYLPTVIYKDVDVAVTVSLSFTDVTGASLYPATVIARGQNTSLYYMLSVAIDTSENITIGLRIFTNPLFPLGVQIVADTPTGLTHSAAQPLRVRFQCEGSTLRGKVWPAASPEPFDWNVTANDTQITNAGWVGVRSGTAAGQTNIPVTFSYDNLTVRVPRFAGEVPAWPSRWDLSDSDTWVPIEAAGLTRRLGQGAAPLKSALYRYYAQLATPPIAYWPAEDLPGSPDELLCVIGNAPPLTPNAPSIVNDVPPPLATVRQLELAAFTSLTASSPFAELGQNPAYDATNNPNPGIEISSFPIPSYTATGQTMARFIMNIPAASSADPEPLDHSEIVNIQVTGTAEQWSLIYRSGGFLQLQATTNTASVIVDTGGASYGGDIRGRTVLVSLQLTESGGNVLWDISELDAGNSIGLHIAGTLIGYTVGGVGVIEFGRSPYFPHMALGHISIRKQTSGFSDISIPLSGYYSESALTRAIRLCGEETVPFSYRGDPTTTTLMGSQGAGAVTSGTATTDSLTTTLASTNQTLLDLLYECEDADMGVLYEPRGLIGLEYRTRTDLYSQAPTLTMDYSLGHVAPPLEPTDDDQLTQNNIIATRVNGGSAEAELTTGRMSTLDPSQGGVGRYDVQYTLNVLDDALADIATVLLQKGTVDEPRYPTISINLANPQTVAAGLEPSALAVNMGDRITVTNPKTGYTPDTISQIVRGYTETLGPFTHTITFNCAPEAPYRVAQVSAPPGAYKVDSLTSTLVSGVTATATTLSVANVNEPWTTDPTQMPIPIMLAGELINITSISGASSPQTFTVTRSVNGVSKAQSAGSVIQIYRPYRPLIGL